LGIMTLVSCIIYNPKPEQCAIVYTKIKEVREGTSFDIVLDDTNGDSFYINRGLEQELNLDALKRSVLNKTVRLHLPKFWIGSSEHIAQIEVNNDTLFTEFQ